jgi:hypothetical protein
MKRRKAVKTTRSIPLGEITPTSEKEYPMMGASMVSVSFKPCEEANQGIKEAIERIDLAVM